MRRYIPLTLLLILALTATIRAENAVRFTDAAIDAGDRVSTDVLLECDQDLIGWNLVLKWSTGDLRCDSVRLIRESFDPRYLFVESPIEQTTRTIRLAIVPPPFGDPPFPITPAGEHLAARLYFTSSHQAPDQIAFVDSGIVLHIEDYRNDTSIEASTYAAQNSVTIHPAFHPGTITIGSPLISNMVILPTGFSLRGEIGNAAPRSRTIEIRSDGNTQFDWEAHWNSDWLDLSPSIGKTPSYPTLYADAFFLLPGTYHDTITVESALAQNSPLQIPVAFVVDTAGSRPPEGFNFSLGQSKPSPFVAYSDPETRIPFLLEEPSHVVIELFDILGRRVKTLTSSSYSAGEADVVWDGRDARGKAVSSGHYICRMATESGESSRVIVLIR